MSEFFSPLPSAAVAALVAAIVFSFLALKGRPKLLLVAGTVFLLVAVILALIISGLKAPEVVNSTMPATFFVAGWFLKLHFLYTSL